MNLHRCKTAAVAHPYLLDRRLPTAEEIDGMILRAVALDAADEDAHGQAGVVVGALLAVRPSAMAEHDAILAWTEARTIWNAAAVGAYAERTGRGADAAAIESVEAPEWVLDLSWPVGLLARAAMVWGYSVALTAIALRDAAIESKASRD